MSQRDKRNSNKNIDKWTKKLNLDSDESQLDDSDNSIEDTLFKTPSGKLLDKPIELTDEENDLSKDFFRRLSFNLTENNPEEKKEEDIKNNQESEQKIDSENENHSIPSPFEYIEEPIIIMTTISEILKDIEKFSGKLADVNKCISSVRAGYQFVNHEAPQDIARYLNGAKNKLDSVSFNTLASEDLSTLDLFVKAIEDTFLISNDPSNTVLAITMKKQKNNENVLDFSNKLLQLHNEYLMLYKKQNPNDVNTNLIAKANETLLTNCFVSNLKEPFATYAKGHKFDTFLEAKRWALDIERKERPVQTILNSQQQSQVTSFNRNQNQPQNKRPTNFQGQQFSQNYQQRNNYVRPNDFPQQRNFDNRQTQRYTYQNNNSNYRQPQRFQYQTQNNQIQFNQNRNTQRPPFQNNAGQVTRTNDQNPPHGGSANFNTTRRDSGYFSNQRPINEVTQNNDEVQKN